MPPVQVHGGEHRLRGVRQDGGPLPAAAGLLAPAQLQILAQAQLLRHLVQALLTHQRRPDPGQVPLRQVRVVAEQELRRDEAQYGVPQELQPLVAVQPGGPVLVGVGAVAQRLLQQSRVPEAVIQFFLQVPHIVSPIRKPRCPRGSLQMLIRSAWRPRSSRHR